MIPEALEEVVILGVCFQNVAYMSLDRASETKQVVEENNCITFQNYNIDLKTIFQLCFWICYTSKQGS